MGKGGNYWKIAPFAITTAIHTHSSLYHNISFFHHTHVCTSTTSLETNLTRCLESQADIPHEPLVLLFLLCTTEQGALAVLEDRGLLLVCSLSLQQDRAPSICELNQIVSRSQPSVLLTSLHYLDHWSRTASLVSRQPLLTTGYSHQESSTPD